MFELMDMRMPWANSTLLMNWCLVPLENGSIARRKTPAPDGHVILETMATGTGETKLAQHGSGRPGILGSEGNGPGLRMPAKHHAHHARGDALSTKRGRYFVPDLHFAMQIRGTGEPAAADDHGLVLVNEKIERPLRMALGKKDLGILGPTTRQDQTYSFGKTRRRALKKLPMPFRDLHKPHFLHSVVSTCKADKRAPSLTARLKKVHSDPEVSL